MTDLELLTAAAKEAGINAEVHSELGLGPEGLWLKGARSTDNSRYWNPLDNDGDALRLAVKLRIEIEPWIPGDSACARASVGEILIDEPHYGDDPGRATRRAIVRAAAEMVSK